MSNGPTSAGERWRRRLDRFSAIEVIAGALIVAVWGLLAGAAVGGGIGIVILMAIGLWLHLTAVETGSHSVLWLSTACLLVMVVIAGVFTFGGLRPLSYAIASTTALGQNELVRVNHARRRGAAISDDVHPAAAASVGLAGLVAVVGIGIAQHLSEGDERPWLWMPATAGALLVLGLLLTLLPPRRAPKANRQRWRPGDRIPPQPLGQETRGPASPGGLGPVAGRR